MYHVMRTGRDPLALAPGARAALAQLDGSVPPSDLQTMESVVRASLGQQRLSLLLLGGFALGALVLATLGIYGVVANTVVRRTREFGVRLALGAERRGVLGLVMADGLRMIVAGLVTGLAGALLLTRVLGRLLFGVNALDPATFITVAFGLGALASVACLIPGWRATRISPAEAMRAD
jgi:putative ABC transport system permease protein